MSTPIVFVGIGNSLRRDDGAGLFLATRLAALLSDYGLPVEIIAVQQPAPELAEELADLSPSAIFFVDAAVGLTAPIVVPATGPAAARPGGSHHLSPAQVMHLARHLYKLTAPAWLIQIPGVDFGHGEGFSTATQQSLNRAETLVQTILDCIRTGD
ncbi:MAG: hydrogenase maturation protease [Caldilineaceae bacterium]|nr:hydrogenase maturation protease [Caldilineaceae bacterium]